MTPLITSTEEVVNIRAKGQRIFASFFEMDPYLKKSIPITSSAFDEKLL